VARLLRVASALLVFFAMAAVVRADDTLVLKDGRRIAVRRLARRDGQVLFETTRGERFSVPEDQVVSPPLDSIPQADAPPAAPVATEQTLVLKDGRRIQVRRLGRRDGLVLFETTRGEAFSVREDQIVSPPLETIPVVGGAAPADQVREQTLVLKDGRRIQVLRLARRGGQVLFQTTRGEGFSVPEDQVVSPAIETIPSLDATPGPVPTPTPAPSPEAPPVPEATPAPPTPPGPARPEPDFVPVRSRWDLPFPADPRWPRGRLVDPYNQNILKGDKPVAGDSVFLVLTGALESPFEGRNLPVGSGVSAERAGSQEFFGRYGMFFTSPRATVSAEVFKGQTAFKPKTFAIKATGVFNLNYLRAQERNVVHIDPREGRTRRREDASLEEAFAEVKLADLSPYYDVVSVRAGIQPFVSDFRGLVFSDTNLGARLFGNASNNRWQYNLAGFDLLEKDTNSDLNTFEKREQRVYVANVFHQDTFTKGYTLSLSYHRSEDRAAEEFHFDKNGFLVRPARIGSPRLHEVTANYVGLAGDGHLGKINVSHAAYYAFGTDEDHGVGGHQDIRAGFGALEASIDKDWTRFKATVVYASGDDDPLDGKANGFDSIYDSSNFAGGPFSFWVRSGIALTQTAVLLKAPGSLLPDLRSNKFEGQANFVNPGIMIAGLGLDADLTPKLRGIVNANYLRFDKTGNLDLLLFQPGIRKSIGIDLGAGFLYRPLLNENVVITAGVTGLLPGKAFEDIFTSTCATGVCGSGNKKLWNAFAVIKLTY
jgi:RNase P/RNase MRP subunit p29